ncbi:hypothetical protein MTO96_049065 [Rhipicephalus appendiculatus]
MVSQYTIRLPKQEALEEIHLVRSIASTAVLEQYGPQLCSAILWHLEQMKDKRRTAMSLSAKKNGQRLSSLRAQSYLVECAAFSSAAVRFEKIWQCMPLSAADI